MVKLKLNWVSFLVSPSSTSRYCDRDRSIVRTILDCFEDSGKLHRPFNLLMHVLFKTDFMPGYLEGMGKINRNSRAVKLGHKNQSNQSGANFSLNPQKLSGVFSYT